MKRNNLHNLKIGEKGFYEGKPCIIDGYSDELTIEVRGMFGMGFFSDYFYKNRWNKFFKIKTWFTKEVPYEMAIDISYYMFEPEKTTIPEKQLA